jgi:hypothetical protein
MARRSRTGFGPDDDDDDDNDDQAAAAGEDHVLDRSASGVGRSAVAPAPPSRRRSIADDGGASSPGCRIESDATAFLRFSARAASWRRLRRPLDDAAPGPPTNRTHPSSARRHRAPRAARRNSRRRRSASPAADNRSTPASEAREGVRPSRWSSESWSRASRSSSLARRSAPPAIDPSR